MSPILEGRELPEEADEESTERVESLFEQPEPIDYNPAFPIETFDIIVTDEAHRSIYNPWRQVLEYFDKPPRAWPDWQLDDDFEYAPEELDRSVQAPDQIRTIARTLLDRWQTRWALALSPESP